MRNGLDKAAEIRRLNDRFRKDPMRYGKFYMTRGVASMPTEFIRKAVQAMKDFSAFDDANDPHGEHDLCAFDIDGVKLFAKVDYYNRTMTAGSEDPSNDAITLRVLTLMRAEDY